MSHVLVGSSDGRFRFIADEADESFATPTAGEEPWATYLGLPDSIIILLADIVNLCADQPTESSLNVKARADKIEAGLNAWKQTLPSTTVKDSTALISRTIAGQLWRLCAIVLLYQVRYPKQLGDIANISLYIGSAVYTLPYGMPAARFSTFSILWSAYQMAIYGDSSLSPPSSPLACLCRMLIGHGR